MKRAIKRSSMPLSLICFRIAELCANVFYFLILQSLPFELLDEQSRVAAIKLFPGPCWGCECLRGFPTPSQTPSTYVEGEINTKNDFGRESVIFKFVFLTIKKYLDLICE